jgi:hypothetical protein
MQPHVDILAKDLVKFLLGSFRHCLALGAPNLRSRLLPFRTARFEIEAAEPRHIRAPEANAPTRKAIASVTPKRFNRPSLPTFMF